MTEWFVELSAENLDLALAELRGAVRALGGAIDGAPGPLLRFVRVVLGSDRDAERLADRLALSRRVIRGWPTESSDQGLARIEGEARAAATGASFRPAGRPTSRGGSDYVRLLATAWKSGGGRIDLTHPERRFVVVEERSVGRVLGEELRAVDRRGLERHRMPDLPFQRPISLRPKLARAAMNLASVRPGDRVVDPFVGTGALLLEGALLGARVSGVDHDPDMVRGAARNLAHWGREAERLIVDDAASAASNFDIGSVDAVVTDPPYGRASGTGGEDVAALVRRALSAWSDRIAPGGPIVHITPGGADPLGEPWERSVCVRDRVHRSLSREFRVYRRRGETDPRSRASLP